jgi:hypothetical protein
MVPIRLPGKVAPLRAVVALPHQFKIGGSMRRLFQISLVIASVLAVAGMVQAQPTAHYCPGAEGAMDASVPPPGFYLRDYNYFYTAEHSDDSSAHSAGPANFEAFTYAQVPRLIWMSDAKFLGADVGTSVLLPVTFQDVRAGPFHQETLGVGDMLVDAILAWHPKRFDFVVAPGVWAPTGDSNTPPTTDAGLGYWGGMLTVGATWYMDTQHSLALSALNRFEINSQQRETHITTGDAYTLEWGLSKSFKNGLMIGAVGYYQQKVTPDDGLGAMRQLSRVVAVGPEIGAVIPKIDTLLTFRYERELIAQNRAQGQTFVLTLTQRF